MSWPIPGVGCGPTSPASTYLFLRYRLLRKESAGSLYDHGHR
jgi:hypothetical protein